MTEAVSRVDRLAHVISNLDDEDRAHIEWVLQVGTSQRDHQEWTLEVGRRLRDVMPAELVGFFLVTIADWRDQEAEEQVAFDPQTQAWLLRLARRYGSSLDLGMRRSLKGDLDWNGITVRAYEGPELSPSIQIDIGLLNEAELKIITDPPGYARLIRSLAGEMDEMESYLVESDDADELLEALDMASEALDRMRSGLRDRVASPAADVQAAEPPAST
jgi:hypothetical protein